jgi:hypothetical protein
MSTGKQKLYTFGCSFTYGQGFPDCDVSVDRTPSDLAWPNHVADSLGLPFENLASPGCSPFELGRRFLRNIHKMSESDIVVIAWPYFDRTCVLLNSGTEAMVKFTPGMGIIDVGKDLLPMDTEYYYKHFTTSTHQLESFMMASKLVDAHCKLKGVNVIQSIFLKEYKDQLNEALKSPDYDWYDVKIENNTFDFIQLKREYLSERFGVKFEDLPDHHRGLEHHKFWAESVRRRIIRKGFLKNFTRNA